MYEHVYGGFMTHVAANKVMGDIPKIVWSADDTDGKILHAQYCAQMKFMETAKREPIGLTADGNDFVDNTPGECADTLESLRVLGYRIPQDAIDALREEQQKLNQEDKNDRHQ